MEKPRDFVSIPEGVRDFSLLESVQTVSILNQPPIEGVP